MFSQLLRRKVLHSKSRDSFVMKLAKVLKRSRKISQQKLQHRWVINLISELSILKPLNIWKAMYLVAFFAYFLLNNSYQKIS